MTDKPREDKHTVDQMDRRASAGIAALSGLGSTVNMSRGSSRYALLALLALPGCGGNVDVDSRGEDVPPIVAEQAPASLGSIDSISIDAAGKIGVDGTAGVPMNLGLLDQNGLPVSLAGEDGVYTEFDVQNGLFTIGGAFQNNHPDCVEIVAHTDGRPSLTIRPDGTGDMIGVPVWPITKPQTDECKQLMHDRTTPVEGSAD